MRTQCTFAVLLLLTLGLAPASADDEAVPALATCVEDEALKVEVVQTVCNTYFLTDKASREFVVVDPGPGTWPLIEAKTAADGKLVAFWITHEHGDHVAGLGELAPKAGVPIVGHEETKKATPALREHWADWGMTELAPLPPVAPDTIVADGGVLKVGGLTGKVLHVPGHSKGSIAFLLGERLLFGGDVLFKGNVGRTDLPTSDLEVFKQSLSTKLWDLDEHVVVFPGHGEPTSIGEEKRGNWLFQDYVRAARSEAPIPRPWMGVELDPERTEPGIALVKVVAGSPAAEAGLQAGDVITSFDGVELSAPRDLVGVVRKHAVGDEVPMTVLRDGATKAMRFKFGARPPL